MTWLEPEEYAAWRRRLAAETVARNLTAARRECLAELLRRLALGHDPTDAEIARATGHGERTVRRARADARRLGLLTWRHTRRLVQREWRQGPNVYAVHVPAGPVCPGGHAGRAKRAEKKERLDRVPQSAALAALAAIAKRREVALAHGAVRLQKPHFGELLAEER